ncbi:MAG: hypothetical protein ACK4N5_08630 [Myxococcales bacterium]
MRRNLLLLLVALLTGCPQDIQGLEDGGTSEGDGGLPPLIPCEREGPTLTCAVAGGQEPLLPLGSLVTIQCEVDGKGRAVLFEQTRITPASANVQDTLNSDRKLVVQLTAARVGTGFRDTQLAVDVTAGFADDVRACSKTRLTAQYAGNLWVADPAGRRVVAVGSDETVIGDAITGAGEPRLVAALNDGVLVGAIPAVGAPPDLHVYGYDGKKLRGPFTRTSNGNDLLAGRTLHSAVQATDGTIYVSLGVGEQVGRLLKYSSDGTSLTEIPMPGNRSPRGMAALPNGGLVVGVAGEGGYARFDAGGTNGIIVVPPFKDTANDSCTINAIFGMHLLRTGELWLSARHTTGTGDRGLHATIKAGVYDRFSPHTHPGQGAMFASGAHDWLAEMANGKLVASREGGSSLDVLDAKTFGAHSPPRTVTTLTWSPRAITRLR